MIHQYPLPEVLPVAEGIFKRLSILTNEIPSQLRESFFTPLLPSVLLLGQTFAPLCSEATRLFVSLARTATAGGAVTSLWKTPPKVGVANDTLATAAQRTFEELIRVAVVKV